MASPSQRRTSRRARRRYSDQVRQASGNSHVPAPVLRDPGSGPDGPGTGAFFDVDNTIIRGASAFHLGVGLYRRGFFRRATWSSSGSTSSGT